MSVHDEFVEDLACYALGALDLQEQAAIEQHLAACDDCLRELQQLRGDAALFALSAVGAEPPRRARRRLMRTVAKEQRARFSGSRAWGVHVFSLVTVAFGLVAFLFWYQNREMYRHVAETEKRAAQLQSQLEQSRELVDALTSTEAVRFTLVSANTVPQPQGRAVYLSSSSMLIFYANNMPPLLPKKAYELWLIPLSGAPIPVGVFKPDAHGNASMVNPPLPLGIRAKTFAITVEPEEGSAAPTSAPVMVGVAG